MALALSRWAAARKALELKAKADNETPAEVTRRIAKINRFEGMTQFSFVVASDDYNNGVCINFPGWPGINAGHDIETVSK